MDNIIKVDSLNFSYRNQEIFNNLRLSIQKGTIVTITGATGVGKTTLIKLLSGILPSTSIYYNNVLLTKKNAKYYLKDIGIIFFDEMHQLLTNNAYDDLIFSLENLNYKPQEIKRKVKDINKLLDLNKILEKENNNLSSYERCKLLLAIAIIHNPKIIYLDNIYYRLNKQEINKINDYLLKINKKEKITIVITTNNLENISISDDVIVLGNKKVILEDTPKDIVNYDKILISHGIEIPIMIDISQKLKIYNLLDEIIEEPESMVRKLW